MRKLVIASLLPGVVACNPSVFSDLEQEAWVDSQDVSAMGSQEKQVAIGPSDRPGDADFRGPELIVVGIRPLSLFKLAYSPDGTLDTTSAELAAVRTAAAANALELFATSPEDGVVAAAIERPARAQSGTGYHLVGEIDDDPDVVGDIDLITEPENRVAETDLAWTTMATTAQALGALAGDGMLDVFSWDNTSVAGGSLSLPGWQGTCQIPSDVLTPSNALAIWDSSEYRFLVGGDEGLASVTLPAMEGDPCEATVLDIEKAIDGRILVGHYLGGADLDVFAVALGDQVRIFTDVTVGGGLGTPRFVPAPSGASGQFGRDIAVGDFDDDGQAELAVGDPGAGAVYVFHLDESDPLQPAKVLTPVSTRSGFGKSLAAVPFDLGAKDLLVVGNDDDVFTYFRIFTSEESSTDNDPRN